jgi:large subunit ribosomal protein L2
MIFKKINPTTPAQRQLKLLSKLNLSKKSFLKFKIKNLNSSNGRNNSGKITSYHRGGGHKRKYREIDFIRNNLEGIVMAIEYDPNRTSFIASIFNYKLNKYSYILAPKNLQIGNIIRSNENTELYIGHSSTLDKFPVGSFIHNVSLKCGSKGQIARSAGTFIQLIRKNKQYARIVLNSGEHRLLLLGCHGTLGIVSNYNNNLKTVGKAGRSRWLNKRPTVRGVAMNPIDHPHGGGEGKTSGGRPSVTPWGKPTKGKPTSRSTNKLILIKSKR